jgi:hypothetical protein
LAIFWACIRPGGIRPASELALNPADAPLTSVEAGPVAQADSAAAFGALISNFSIGFLGSLRSRRALCNANLYRYHGEVPMKHGDNNPGQN